MNLGITTRVLLYFTVGAVRGHVAAVALGLISALFKMPPNKTALLVSGSASFAGAFLLSFCLCGFYETGIALYV